MIGRIPAQRPSKRPVRIQRGETLMQFADLLAWSQRFDAVRSLLTDPTRWPDGIVVSDHSEAVA